MTLIIGVGQGGCNLAAEMARVPQASGFLDVFLINSTMRDMVHITEVPRSHWIGINESKGLVQYEDGLERELTGGMGKDPRRCFTSLTAAFDSITTALNGVQQGPAAFDFKKERFALVLFSAAGGTGAGAAPVIARALREVADGACKVIGVMILPASIRAGEKDIGGLRDSWNAWYSMKRSLEVFDGLILVDNERLSSFGDIERAFPRFNEYVARSLTDMVLGNLTELVLPEQGELVVQQNDTMDLVTALSVGGAAERKPGVAGIGRAVQMLRSPIGYVLPFLPAHRMDLVTLGALARERLTLREPGANAHEKAYVLVRAPRKSLGGSTTGHDASEILATIGHPKCHQIVYGTALTRRPLASVTLGLTYKPENHPRLHQLQADAQRYEKEAGVPSGE